jgi:hypothetical protein
VSGLPIKAKPSKGGGAKSERLKPAKVAGQDRPTAEGETRRRKVMGLKPQCIFVVKIARLPKSKSFAGMTRFIFGHPCLI